MLILQGVLAFFLFMLTFGCGLYCLAMHWKCSQATLDSISDTNWKVLMFAGLTWCGIVSSSAERKLGYEEGYQQGIKQISSEKVEK